MTFWLRELEKHPAKPDSNGNRNSDTNSGAAEKREEDTNVVEFEPDPWFVVKTTYTSSHKVGTQEKLFVNVTTNDHVPLPDIAFDARTVFPMIMNNAWEIPIVTGALEPTTDRKGAAAWRVTCCIHPECRRWCETNTQLREILVEWCLESCELRERIVIDHDKVRYPRLRHQGPQEVMQLLRDDLDPQPLSAPIEGSDGGPLEILRIQRDQYEESDTELPPLIPEPPKPQRTLIQEIDDLSIVEMRHGDPVQNTSAKILDKVHYEVAMRKISGIRKHQLRIDINSELERATDYNLQLDIKSNALIITNSKATNFQKTTLEIPLPYLNFEPSEMKVFFTRVEPKLTLVIFI